jgi:hypothetical protein
VDEGGCSHGLYHILCDKPEELGYSIEERPAELDIMPVEDGPPYDGNFWFEPAAFMGLGLGGVRLNELEPRSWTRESGAAASNSPPACAAVAIELQIQS